MSTIDKLIGISTSDIAKVNGVAVAGIYKVDGILWPQAGWSDPVVCTGIDFLPIWANKYLRRVGRDYGEYPSKPSALSLVAAYPNGWIKGSWQPFAAWQTLYAGLTTLANTGPHAACHNVALDKRYFLWVESAGTDTLYLTYKDEFDVWTNTVIYSSGTYSIWACDMGMDSQGRLHIAWVRHDNTLLDDIYYQCRDHDLTILVGSAAVRNNAKYCITCSIMLDSSDKATVFYGWSFNHSLYYKQQAVALGAFGVQQLANALGGGWTYWHSDTMYDSSDNMHAIHVAEDHPLYVVEYGMWNGIAWDAPFAQLSPPAGNDGGQPMICMDSLGQVHAIYESKGYAPYAARIQVIHRIKSIGGVWGAATVVYPEDNDQRYPTIACLSTGGVYCTFTRVQANAYHWWSLYTP